MSTCIPPAARLQVQVAGLESAGCSIVALRADLLDKPPKGSRGLERPGSTTFLMKPFFGLQPHEYAAILAWHVVWHVELGVHRYVVYALSHSLPGILNEPLIKTLIGSGMLQLVQWDDMASHTKADSSTSFSHYADQAIIYNHGMLALHARESLVLVADLDEYLFTREALAASQVQYKYWFMHVQRRTVVWLGPTRAFAEHC